MAASTYPVVPALRYRDAHAALDFLTHAFGFVRQGVMEREDGSIGHAELRHGDGFVMIGQVREDDPAPYQQLGPCCLYAVVQDADAHHAQAVEAGARIVQPPTDQEYGSRDYLAQDPEGNLWCFGTYAPRL
ncbi:bleomycin resistance protein [Streptomyces sp. AJS327]|uniref:VOC family protein n=1 Tax=Streptomyces sp. AJS327 TaxID=2545265 RepID=UPI0015DFE052|nr:VOC family protein [Streptomyces sp. AJS327]MBA0054178.1 bleomycin resistance protein [Streptomyces sp. AJS327]